MFAFPPWRAVLRAACLALLLTLPASNFAGAQTNAPAPRGPRRGSPLGPADQPRPRSDPNSLLAHEQLLAKAKQGGIDIYFEGDSITRRWGTSDAAYRELYANWRSNFFGWNAADFGWGADLIQNILWRLDHGELDGVHPKIIVLLAGINNVGSLPPTDESAAEVTRGIQAILERCRAKAPDAVIVLTALFPRNDRMEYVPVIQRINQNLIPLADGKRIRLINVNDQLADPSGKLFPGMVNARDQLHPNVPAYQIWANALKPIFTELLGPPAATDHAPPPTGDPSAKTAAPPAPAK